LKKEKVSLIITDKVYEKIKYLCTNISQVEWSGTLFYTIKKELSSGKCEVELKDILPLDKGTGTYTSFESDERFPEYMMSKMEELGEEVLTWQQGLIHSHNNMGVFFSGTDQDELLSSCKNYNQYLSLICNNKMEFVAKIAQHSTAQVVTKGVPMYALSISGEKIVVGKEDLTAVKSGIKVYDCDIEIPETVNKVDPIFLNFFNRIMKDKPTKVASTGGGNFWKGGSRKANKQASRFPKKSAHTQQKRELDNFSWPYMDYLDNEKESFFAQDPYKEVFAVCSNIETYLKNWESFEDEELLQATEEILDEFNCEVETTAKDFVATLITKCTKEGLDFLKEANGMASYINENCPMGTTYLVMISNVLDGTINNLKKRVNG